MSSTVTVSSPAVHSSKPKMTTSLRRPTVSSLLSKSSQLSSSRSCKIPIPSATLCDKENSPQAVGLTTQQSSQNCTPLRNKLSNECTPQRTQKSGQCTPQRVAAKPVLATDVSLDEQLARKFDSMTLSSSISLHKTPKTPRPSTRHLIHATKAITSSKKSYRRSSSGPLTPVIFKSITPVRIKHTSPVNSHRKYQPKHVVSTSPLNSSSSLTFNWSQPAGILHTEKKSEAPDRFVSARQDLGTSRFQMSRDTTSSIADTNESTGTFTIDPTLLQSTLDSSSLAYQSEAAKACGLDLDKRVLNFRPSSSVKKEPRTNLNRPVRPHTSSAVAKRKISTVAERVLDAPGIVDDYYLNLLDWSASNVLAVGLGSAVYLWDAAVGTVRELCSLNNDDDNVASLNWSSDGAHLAIADFNGNTHVWDVESSTKLRTIRDHTSRIGSLSWNAYTLTSGSRDGVIHHNDVRLPRARTAQLSGHTGDVCGLKWSFDGSQLASGGNDNLVNIWDVRQSAPKYTKRDHTAAVKALAWCPWQSNLLATGGGSDDKKICFWNTSTGVRDGCTDTGSQVTGIYFSKFYRELVSSHGFSENQLTLWKYPTMKRVVDIPHAHESRILHTTMSPDGQTVCTGAADENLKFWKVFAMDSKSVRRKGSKSAKTDLTQQSSPNFGCSNIR